jgi:hypothetical protein
MTSTELTLAEFARHLERAGLRLGPGDMATLYGEIAASCQIVGEMAERVRARLEAARLPVDGPLPEPAHIFSREPDHGDA